MATNNINVLLTSGFDAFSNLYSVTITPAGATLPLPEVRVKDFKAPTLTLGEYEQHLKTISITRPTAQFTGDREFELVFRIDSNWDLYDKLKAWRKLYYTVKDDKVNLGLYSSVAGSSYGTVVVKVFSGTGLQDGSGTTNDSIIWTYENVMLYELIEPAFTRATSGPVEVTGKFMFGNYSSTTTKVKEKPLTA